MTDSRPRSKPAESISRSRAPRGVRRLADSPLIALTPWIVVGVGEGPGRTSWVAGSALALSLLIIAADVRLRRSVKLLGVVGALFFAALLAFSHLAAAEGLAWLEKWLGEASNLTLAAVIACSMLARFPFTIQYTRERVPPELWRTRAFVRTNYIVTGVWAAAFLFAGLIGLYGELALHNSSNPWTNWILQLSAVVVAAAFYSWYPRAVRARRRRRPGGQHTEPAPPASEFLNPILKLMAAVGVVSLILGAAPMWFGVGLVVLGVVGVFAIHEAVLSLPEPRSEGLRSGSSGVDDAA